MQNQNQIMPWSRAFVHVWRLLCILALSCHWFIVLLKFVVIGHWRCFGFGFTTTLKENHYIYGLTHDCFTWEQVAMVLTGRPTLGAQATSLTQSLCASSFSSSTHWPSTSLYMLQKQNALGHSGQSRTIKCHTDQNNNTNVTYLHTFTKLSHPPVTNLLTKTSDFDPG